MSVEDLISDLLASSPVTATFVGDHAHDARLPDWSIREQELSGLRIHSSPANGVDARRLREEPARLDRVLVSAAQALQETEESSGHFTAMNPALWTGEAIFGIVSLMLRDFAPASERVVSIESRLRETPRFLTTLSERIEESRLVPTLWRDRAARECKVAETLLTASLRAWCVENDVAYPESAANLALQQFGRIRQWLQDHASEGVDPPAVGQFALTSLIELGHAVPTNARLLLNRAESAMEEERDALAADVYVFPGQSWSAVQAAIAADHPAPRDFYAAFERRWEQIREATQEVVTWPNREEWPIRYRPFPEWARDIAPSLYWLFYRSPSPYDPSRTHDYWTPVVDESVPADILASRLATWNNTQITLNHVVHHGGLGHHVQNWHATTRSRSQIGRIAAVDAASRIALYCGGTMAEGWACYATGLVEEMGLLTRLERLSEQHTRVRLLARCIVDLRFHLGDWSFDECVAYWQRATESPREVAIAEATKISMFPGTGLMYWLGVDAIKGARRALELKQGASFSLKRFHDDLLSWGSIPAPLAARMLTA